MSTSLRSISRVRFGLLSFLLIGGACADDAPPITTSDTGTGTTTDNPPVTTMDPDTTAGTETTRGDATDTTTAATTEGSTTSVAACGNGVLDDGEDCDGDELDGQDCTSQGFSGGELACADDCTFDTSGCTRAPACGNDVVDGDEVCDGTDLGGEDCTTQGFASGRLACLDDCTGFDTAACMAAPASSCCNANPGMTGCDDPACEAQICGLDAYCCDTEWDDVCAAAATGVDGNGNECAICPAPMCGNDIIELGEACDGADLNGQDCTTQGFMSGNLACAGDCSSFDTSGCMDPTQDCCMAQMGLTGCADAACEAAICGFDAYCCDTEWDDICANEASAEPACAGTGTCPPPDVCGDGIVGMFEACDGADVGGATCDSAGLGGAGPVTCAPDCASLDVSSCNAPVGYGNCTVFDPLTVCTAEEVCASDGTNSVCFEPDCADVTACGPAPATGNAPVTCQDANGDGTGDCYLSCDAGETCPNGMSCELGFICLWPPA